MTELKTEHATIVVERVYPASPERVFAAWADPEQRKQWDSPGEGWVVAEQEQDFRVGGVEASRFGPKDDPQYRSYGHFLDIVPNRRIVSAGTMHAGDTPSSSTLCTIEIMPEGAGTRLKMTDQSVYFDGETPQDRTEGWNEIVGKLGAYLGKA